MKKFVAMIMCLTITAFAFGCGDKKTEKKTTEEKTESKTESK